MRTIGDGTKVFVNVCQTDAIPPPEPISREELQNLLATEKESNYRVPMSVSEMHQVDHRGASHSVCDVAIHPLYMRKVVTDEFFSDFLIQIIIEAIDQKYNIQLDGGQCVILKNKKQIGTLVRHRIQNRDVQKVYESYKNVDEETRAMIEKLEGNSDAGGGGGPKKNLIEVIEDSRICPEWRMLLRQKDRLVKAEFYLPSVCSACDIELDVGEDRISLRVPKHNYYLDGFVAVKLDVDKAVTEFELDTSVSIQNEFK